ncbi:MAG: hypothetical protein ABIP54_02355, partial [Candidatus Andersenbacteria bacterium]
EQSLRIWNRLGYLPRVPDPPPVLPPPPPLEPPEPLLPPPLPPEEPPLPLHFHIAYSPKKETETIKKSYETSLKEILEYIF